MYTLLHNESHGYWFIYISKECAWKPSMQLMHLLPACIWKL